MAEKVSVKTTAAIFLLCMVVLALCGCIIPIDIELFLEASQVQVIIEKAKETVKIDPTSDPGLTEGNKRISGLNPQKYYMIEKEIDIDGTPVDLAMHPVYVTDYTLYGSGGQTNDLGQITKISGGIINGLKNFHTYTVKSAVFYLFRQLRRSRPGCFCK